MPNPLRALPLAAALFAVLACIFGPGGIPTPPQVATLTAMTGTPPAPPATPATPKFATPTAPPDAGTLSEAAADGQRLSHPDYYWRLTLPAGWEVTYDRGFELHARGPGELAFLRLLSLVWATTEERPPTSHAFVEFWRNHPYGDVFPIYANGDLVSEIEISAEKFGGPYRQFIFDDADADVHYIQVYASGGGPSSIVLTVWSGRADFQPLEHELQGIVESLAAVEAPER